MRTLRIFGFILWALTLFFAGELAVWFCARSRWRLNR